MRFNYQNAEYMMGASELKQLPEDIGVEVAFAGRSNAGKSSALNKLTDQHSLARTSKTPGRTQLINLFSLEEDNRLVDLPGYGFARVSKKVKEHWQRTLSLYLQKRQCLQGLVILMDIRHPCKDMDLSMINWAIQADLDVMILLSKSDKVKQSERSKSLKKVKAEMAKLSFNREKLSILAFSALKGEGVEGLKLFLDALYQKKPSLRGETG